MESIPAQINRFLKKHIKTLRRGRTPTFIILVLIAAFFGATLWGVAAIGLSRQFRLLSMVAPVAMSWLAWLFAEEKKSLKYILIAFLAFLISFFLGKYIIFSHFFSPLPGYTGAVYDRNLEAVITYYRFLCNSTHWKLLLDNGGKVGNSQDIIWMLAGVFAIYKNQWWFGTREKSLNKPKKYIKRRFRE